jgi:hypothetical protein
VTGTGLYGSPRATVGSGRLGVLGTGGSVPDYCALPGLGP